MLKRKKGLDKIVNKKTRVLILGPFPGEDSLKAGKYYANTRNNFWKIMFKVLKKPDPQDYEKRIALLLKERVGLWDVVHSCMRKGSLDTKISNFKFNDISLLIKRFSGVKAIFLNGKKSGKLFRNNYGSEMSTMCVMDLPSTSPANAGQSFAFKYSKWKKIRIFLTGKTQGGGL